MQKHTYELEVDEMVKTHEEMYQLLRYSALGAEVQVEPIRGNGKENTEAMRCFTITVGGANPQFAASQTNIYALPCSPEQMQKAVAEILVRLDKEIRNKKATLSS